MASAEHGYLGPDSVAGTKGMTMGPDPTPDVIHQPGMGSAKRHRFRLPEPASSVKSNSG